MGSVTWIDSNGILWLFGGQSNPTEGVSEVLLSDMWSLNTTTLHWTFIGGSNVGINDDNNWPYTRKFSHAWVRGEELWMFGGVFQQYDSKKFYSTTKILT